MVRGRCRDIALFLTIPRHCLQRGMSACTLGSVKKCKTLSAEIVFIFSTFTFATLLDWRRNCRGSPIGRNNRFGYTALFYITITKLDYNLLRADNKIQRSVRANRSRAKIANVWLYLTLFCGQNIHFVISSLKILSPNRSNNVCVLFINVC